MTEEEILRQFSSPGLRRNTLSREAKKNHLDEAYKIRGERAEKILDELYTEPDPPTPRPDFTKECPRMVLAKGMTR